jgi:hypothetical protein
MVDQHQKEIWYFNGTSGAEIQRSESHVVLSVTPEIPSTNIPTRSITVEPNTITNDFEVKNMQIYRKYISIGNIIELSLLPVIVFLLIMGAIHHLRSNRY